MSSFDVANARDPKNRLRVGFVVHKMQVAGAEMLVAETIRSLADEIDPTIFCLDGLGRLGRELKLAGVPVVWLGRRPGIDLRVAVRMGRELRKRGIEVLHAHQYTPFFYSALARAAMARGVRLILTEHGRHFPDRVSRKRRSLNRLVFSRLTSGITGCSRFSCQALVEIDGFPGEQVSLIENGIESRNYSRSAQPGVARQELDLAPDRSYVVCVARFHPVKDHGTLVRAFAEICREHQEVDLLLVGDGPLRSNLTKLVDDLSLGHRVKFLGVREDVPAILGVSDIFAMTSLSEAASLTVLEAMASQLPVVVTEVGGNPEMVRDGQEGLLVPRGGVEETASALRVLIESPDRAREMGEAGRRRVEERYQLAHAVAAYHALYMNKAPWTHRQVVSES